MTRTNGRRARLGSLLALALGAFALLALPGIAAAKDRNHDHIPDHWEKRHNLSLQVNQAGRDQDGDHLRNLAEFKAEDNPRDADTDNDGITDGEENAGTVASFDTESGKLTISLFGTETISGLVTEGTEIECHGTQSPGAGTSSDSSESSDDNGGDNSGPGSPGSGDGGELSGTPCTVSDLVPGAVVHEAELQVENGAATFDKVELGG